MRWNPVVEHVELCVGGFRVENFGIISSLSFKVLIFSLVMVCLLGFGCFLSFLLKFVRLLHETLWIFGVPLMPLQTEIGHGCFCSGRGAIVTVGFRELLSELVPYGSMIYKSNGCVLPSDCKQNQQNFSKDRTVTAKAILDPPLVKDPPSFHSLPQRKGEICTRGFFFSG